MKHTAIRKLTWLLNLFIRSLFLSASHLLFVAVFSCCGRYIETLGYLYMMQLRYRNGFAKRACSAWRLIFVLSLMPWLHKYRDMTRPEHFGDDEEDDGPVDQKKNSLWGGDNQTRRLLQQSILQSRRPPELFQSQRLELMSMRSLLIDDIDEGSDEDENVNANPDNKTPDSERALQIKEEMMRLQNELDRIESRAAVGQEMPVMQGMYPDSFFDAAHSSVDANM